MTKQQHTRLSGKFADILRSAFYDEWPMFLKESVDELSLTYCVGWVNLYLGGEHIKEVKLKELIKESLKDVDDPKILDEFVKEMQAYIKLAKQLRAKL